MTVMFSAGGGVACSQGSGGAYSFRNKNIANQIMQYCCVACCRINVARITTPIVVARLCHTKKKLFPSSETRKIRDAQCLL